MHDCSLCGQACYCHGDIDDCQVETEEYAYMNCDGCGCHEENEFIEDDGPFGECCGAIPCQWGHPDGCTAVVHENESTDDSAAPATDSARPE